MADFEFEELPPVIGHNQGPDLEDDINFEEDAKIAVSEQGLSRVAALSNEYADLKQKINEAEGVLEGLKARFDQVRYYELPDCMIAAGMDEIKSNGMKISVGKFVRASLSKDPDARKKAADWLREHHKGAIIKRQVGVTLGVGHDEQADAAMKALQKTLPNATVTDTVDVHHSTLSATIKEMMEQGEPVPTSGEEIGMNLFIGREAKVSKAKR